MVRISRWRNTILVLLLLVVLLGGYWLLPIRGQVLVTARRDTLAVVMPHIQVDPLAPQPGQNVTVSVTDAEPWAHVLLTVDGQWLRLKDWSPNVGGTWTWRWTFTATDAARTLVFYHDCQTGCIERGRAVLGTRAAPTPARLVPTKLGVVFANPERDWHGHSAWDVELTYARLADREHWGVDDLATRVQQLSARGLRVLVRVDYAQDQSLPPASDNVALSEYLEYLRRLARDARLREVYAYIIGSGFNAIENNRLTATHPVSPQWYARLFNGYGEALSHDDNAVQTIRAENPQARVLVGPVQPWNQDQNGERHYVVDVPWLNYLNTLVAAVDESARAKTEAGMPLSAPDGFAIQAPARLDASTSSAQEPSLELRKKEWGEAQAGFRVYDDWLDIINSYATTRGMPIFITSTNTFAPDVNTVPAQNYVRGWLTSALQAINAEPQVQALCWFLDDDRSGDTRWDWFSLTKHPGKMVDAAEEFDSLLQERK